MAKVASAGSSPTGMFVPCPMNSMRSKEGKPLIHPHPVAVAVQKGPSKHWYQCSCKFFAYLPKAWQSSWGLTLTEAQRAGLLVLSTV